MPPWRACRCRASTPEAEAREERRKTLHDIVELAAKFFEATLASRAGAKARGYLADRGIEPKTQLKFRIGYASPERYALKEHLGAQGISTEDMVEAGLLVSGEDIPVPYDRFRDRVMFPIADLRGRTIAFGGRALEKDVPAKYLNSPETPLFHKGANLYNGAAARQAAHDGAPIIVVEGYVDVIAMVTAGYEAAVAPLGTALTEDQLALIWKMTDEPVLCFDGDGAGRRAAYRAVDLALPYIKPGKTVKFALLPEGQDPDDLMRSGGREAITEVIGAARPLADMLWQRETEAGGFDTPERRAGLDQRIAEVTNADQRSLGAQILPAGSGRAGARAVRARAATGERKPPRWEGRSGKPGPLERPRPLALPGARCSAVPEPAPCGELARARHAQRAAGARGADPARGHQSPVAARHARRGAGRRSSSVMPDGDRLRAAILDAAATEHPVTPGRDARRDRAREGRARCSPASSRRLPIRQIGRRAKPLRQRT